MLGPETCWVPKIVEPTEFWVPKNSWAPNNFGPPKMIDGQLQLQDEGVANLFYEDEKEPLVEVIKEEL